MARQRHSEREIGRGERARVVLLRRTAAGEDGVAPAAVESAAQDTHGGLVGCRHRPIAGDDDDALLEGGDGGGVAPLDGGSGLGFLLGALALRDVAQNDLVRRLAAPCGADAHDLDDELDAVGMHHRHLGALHGIAGFVQLVETGDDGTDVGRADEQGHRLAQGLGQHIQPGEVQSRRVGVDDDALLVDDDPVRRVLDQQLEAFSDVGRDPRHRPGIAHVGHDPEEALGLGEQCGPHENPVDDPAGLLHLLNELVVVPHHTGPHRLHDRRQQYVAQILQRHGASFGPRRNPVASAGGGVSDERFEA